MCDVGIRQACMCACSTTCMRACSTTCSQAYCNPAYLAEHQLGEEEFSWLTTMTCWATNKKADFQDAFGVPKEVEPPVQSPSEAPQHTPPGPSHVTTADAITSHIAKSMYWGLETLSAAEKQRLGLRAKLILDTGRVRLLRLAGYDASIVQYVENECSPECRLIVAVLKE